MRCSHAPPKKNTNKQQQQLMITKQNALLWFVPGAIGSWDEFTDGSGREKAGDTEAYGALSQPANEPGSNGATYSHITTPPQAAAGGDSATYCQLGPHRFGCRLSSPPARHLPARPSTPVRCARTNEQCTTLGASLAELTRRDVPVPHTPTYMYTGPHRLCERVVAHVHRA